MLLIVLASGCNDNDTKMSVCILNTISITPPGTVYTAHYNNNLITELSNCCDKWMDWNNV